MDRILPLRPARPGTASDVDDFSVNRSSEGGCEVVAVSGELDAFTNDDLAMCLDEVLSADETAHLIVDLTGVGFLDSTAIGLLIRTRQRVDAAGGRLAIVGITGPAGRLFAMTKVDTVLDLVPTREAAVAALSSA